MVFSICFLCALFGFYLSSKQITDPFLYFDVAFTKQSLSDTHLVVPQKGPFASLDFVVGRIILMSILSKVTNLNVVDLQFFPIGYLLSPIILFVLTNKLFNSLIVSTFLTLSFIFNPSQITAFYSIFAYSFAFPLYLSFILVYFNLLRHRKDPAEIIILIILFISCNYIHYTITFWMILFLLSINGYLYITKKFSNNLTQSLLISCFVIFFYFNKVLYKSYLPEISAGIDTTSTHFLLKLPFFSNTFSSEYFYLRPFEINFISSLHLFVVLALVMVGIFFVDIKRVINKTFSSDFNFLLRFSLLFTGFLDVILYSIRGDVSTKYITVMFPFVIFSYLMVEFKKYTKIIILLLSLLLIVKLFLFVNLDYIGNPSSSYKEINPSAEWYLSNTKDDLTLSTDLGIYGILLVNSDKNISLKYMPYDSDIYKCIINVNKDKPKFDYLILDMKSTCPIYGFYWNRFKPLTNYRDSIYENKNLNKIYCDQNVWIMRYVH